MGRDSLGILFWNDFFTRDGVKGQKDTVRGVTYGKRTKAAWVEQGSNTDLSDGPGFVVAANQLDSFGVAKFQTGEKGYSLDGVKSTVDVVACASERRSSLAASGMWLQQGLTEGYSSRPSKTIQLLA